MQIPELTEGQLRILNDVCAMQVPVFSQCESLPSDPLPAQIILKEAADDVAHLVSISLLKEITESHKELVEKTNADSGRVWHLYQAEPLAIAMFSTQLSAAIH
jgi:hypothetical protein